MEYVVTKSNDTIEEKSPSGTDELEFDPSTSRVINPKTARFPYCIVWTPIPLITWLIPWIGHVGIATSGGIIHDFAGSYYISVDDFSFGAPHKFVQLDVPDGKRQEYDRAITAADDCYRQTMHNLFCNNCHSHVADVLQRMKYGGRECYNMVIVWWMLITKSHYVSYWHLVLTYLPFVLMIGTILSLIFLSTTK